MIDWSKRFAAAALLSLCVACFASAELADRINAALNRSSREGVQLSVRVIDADSGREVYSRNDSMPLTCASNMKLIVSSAALHYLGPDYRYSTVVGLSGKTLVVKGSGDPLLGDEKIDAKYGRQRGWVFRDVVSVLKKKGIGSVKDIIVDAGIFDDERVHPNWLRKDLNKWYAAEVCGVNYNDNCIAISTINNGGSVEVLIEPQTGFIKYENEVRPTSKGAGTIGSYRTTEPNRLIIRGTCRSKLGPFDVAIEEPAAFFGYMLAEHLQAGGITIRGRLYDKVAEPDYDLEPLAVYHTSLADCLERCNKNSLGIVAEAMLKTIAAESTPLRRGGSWEKGRELIGDYLMGLGLNPTEFNIDDGSGLSRENRLSANVVSTVLFRVYNSSDWNLLGPSLAVGGEDGTIGRYFNHDDYEGKVIAKTGYISGVRALSGVCMTGSGDFIFSIIANRIRGRTYGDMRDAVKAIIDEYDD